MIESHHRRKDGSLFPVEVNVTYIRLDHDYNLAVVRDITERKRAECALIESHNLLNAIVQSTSDAVFVKDLEGRYVMINSAGAHRLHRSVEDVIGRTDFDLMPAETAESLTEHDRKVLTTGESQTLAETMMVAEVMRTYISTKGVYRDPEGRVIGLVGIATDVSELRRLEEQFRQAQKMDALGRLAGGVAHDFNNLLTVINAYCQLVFDRVPEGDPNREMLTQILHAGERAAGLARQLLDFSRKDRREPQIIDVNFLLFEQLRLLQRLLGEDVELIWRSSAEPGFVKIDPVQLEQAIINLAINARDAMPDGGQLVIEARNVEIEENDAEHLAETQPGRYVLVCVTDTGQGMDESTRTRLFEPFFTTKEAGKGTGLGLAMVYSFVNRSGGHVEVESELGRGTTFKIYLPHTAEATQPAPPSQDLPALPAGSETILLVEDDESVRTLAKVVLESCGYTVVEAGRGHEALRAAERHAGVIDLLLTDVVMPGMNGRRLAELLAKSRPQTRVLFISGHVDDIVARQGLLEPELALLKKPFTPIGLAREVRRVLDLLETSA
ncbi:MAG: PAS domain-containing protein [Thermoanaerobaculia bacterium]|nr:PAS domain-containing protein [Thermoanaerobaculia bacterium]